MKKKLVISLFLFLALMFSNAFANNIEDATQYYNEGIDLYRQDNVNASIDMFYKAIKLKPDFYEARYNLSQILMSIDKNEDALKQLQELLVLNMNDSETLYNIGKIQYKRGYLSDSYKHLERILESAPQYPSAKILMDKIEKRQAELALENIINEHKDLVDEKGIHQTVDISEVQAPSGVAVDSAGNIFVASFAQNAINKISATGKKSVFSNSSLIKGPIGITIDKEDNIYIANYTSNNIIKITPNGNASIFASVQKPYCIMYDEKHDRLYITEQQTNKIIKLDL